MEKVYVVVYKFYSFGLEELESKPELRSFDSYQEYTFWITDLEHDKNLHNYKFVHKEWITRDEYDMIKYSQIKNL